MSTRSPDGRSRNLNQPIVLSSDALRAQWVEIEAMRTIQLFNKPPHGINHRMALTTAWH